jgi:hypothetical protein
MKNSFFLLILSSLSSHCSTEQSQQSQHQKFQSAITWKANGGRFGDNLLSYARSKWISYKFNIPILYVPFKYSEQLMLHEQENIYTESSDQLFSAITYIPSVSKYQLLPYSNTLYISHWNADITIDWYDQVFVKELKRNITPRYQLNKVIVPDGYMSVAVHVRNGGGFTADNEQEQERCPLRFVPDEFFINQIARIADMFKEQNLYVYIFTDHLEPAKLKKKFKQVLNNPRITFAYRKENNSHNSNVLEDFFSMMDFDCLIRPGSHFSRFVQRLGNNKIVIYPESVRKTSDGKSVINVINIKTRAHVNDRWKTKKITIA